MRQVLCNNGTISRLQATPFLRSFLQLKHVACKGEAAHLLAWDFSLAIICHESKSMMRDIPEPAVRLTLVASMTQEEGMS